MSSLAARRVLADTLVGLESELETETKTKAAAERKAAKARAAIDKLNTEIESISKALEALGGPPPEEEAEE